MGKGAVHRGVVRVGPGGSSTRHEDAIAVEEPLEIRVDGETVAVTMRTPGQDAELALGFLFAEGIIAGAGDVGTVAHCGHPGDEGYGNVVDVRSAGGHRIDVDRVLEGRRWSTTTSACGVCGRRSIEGLLERCAPLPPGERVPVAEAARAVERLAASQPVFARTGGLHASVIHAAGGEVLSSAEDVGRHNAVDKAVGTLLRRGSLGVERPAGPAPAILAVSGRTSFEIVQKAAAARIPCVASVSAPSSLAIDLAEAVGITLLGFVRSGSFNLYTSR